MCQLCILKIMWQLEIKKKKKCHCPSKNVNYRTYSALTTNPHTQGIVITYVILVYTHIGSLPVPEFMHCVEILFELGEDTEPLMETFSSLNNESDPLQ